MDERSATELFARLLNALSEALPADRPIAPLSGDGPFLVAFEIGSQPVKLLCNPALTPPCVVVACPLGPVPADQVQAEAMLRQLLRASHLAAGSGTSIAYEPGDRCLHFLHRAPLAAMSAHLLLATMTGLADMTQRWRNEHVLGAPSAPLAGGPTAGLFA